MLLHLVRSVYPDTPAVFIDTGLEFPEIREFVKTFDNVEWRKPEINFKRVIETYGYPVISKEVSHIVDYAKRYKETGQSGEWAVKMLNGEYMNPATGQKSRYNKKKYKYLAEAPFKISDMCCNVMKKNTAHQYQKESGRNPIIGTMTDESSMRTIQWLRFGCTSFEGKNIYSKPISFWTAQDILEYILRYDLPYASVYGEIKRDENGILYTTGCDRTGCMFCMFGCHLEEEPNRFQRLKQTHPKVWEYCMRPWEDGGLGLKKVLDFINVKYE